ncbi:MAG: hypothetical protein Q9169_006292 [Polycauliona sp. 2 TL-2023]
MMGDPQSSALTSYIEASKPINVSPQDSYHHALAAQVLHNLQYQHDWSELGIHTQSPDSGKPLSKPLVTGLPPSRIYVHPDEQIEMLKQGVPEKDVPSEREWVLPTHLRETWSLRKFAEVFDGINQVPPAIDHAAQDKSNVQTGQGGIGTRRGGKRLLLATVGDDSTVVYYVVHDGIVKPRQN